MSTNEAAKLVAVPTYTVELATLLEAQARLERAGMRNLAERLSRRIKTDPRQRALEQAIKTEIAA